jgi:hypothetical protein
MVPSPSFDWPQSASSILAQAMADASIVKLILAGTSNVSSWVIENQVLPLIRAKGSSVLYFQVQSDEQRMASLAPLADGSAFARNANKVWFPLEPHEALEEIQYIGFRFAPGDRWRSGFDAWLQAEDGSSILLAPMEVAGIWERATGSVPNGFKEGLFDRAGALGHDLIDKIFNTQGRLGL